MSKSEFPKIPRLTANFREGTVTGPAGAARLEPKVMDVLGVLSRNQGRVVTRDELMDAVWPNVVVTEHTLSRCIYRLRTELGNIGRQPGESDFNPIETLPKRGYRLLAPVEDMAGEASAILDQHGNPPPISYVVGQWVRGERFYGRAAQLSEILEGPRNCLWLLGTRRIGKTSLLKQAEALAGMSSELRYFPVFWDFQGADTADELNENFMDALLDSDERLARLGITPDEIDGKDLFDSLDQLRRKLRERNLRLLLLCDEVEELIGLQKRDPSLLGRLRRTLQSREDIRTVLASTIRLWALAGQKVDTSPFLHGFTPPLYIERLSANESQALIEQSHLPAIERPAYDAADIKTIRRHCGDHPYLTQLVCKRYLEFDDLQKAIDNVARDRMVSYFFSVDFDMLSEAGRSIVHQLATQSQPGIEQIASGLALQPDVVASELQQLDNLGFVRAIERGKFEISNFFFARWLLEERDHTIADLTPVDSEKDANQQSQPVDKRAPGARNFIAEIKRRSVVRVAVAYVLAAWVLLQIAEVTFGFLEIPNWAGRLLIALLGLGFPIAVVFAWAFELTPDGVKREADVDRSIESSQRAGRKLDLVIIVIALVALGLFVVDRFV